MKALGTVNPCMMATFWKGGRVVARAMDTTNARAHAFKWSGAEYATVQYPGFKPERVERHGFEGSPMSMAEARYTTV
jgi:hypothetical protein